MARDFPSHIGREFPIDDGRDFPLIGGGLPSAPETDPDFSSVVLLLHLNGVDEATTTTDDSDSNHTISFNDNAQLNTAQKKFGLSSLLCDGTADFISAADSADWDFGSGNFTVEGFFRWTTDTAAQFLFGQWDTTTNQRAFTVDRATAGNTLRLLTSTNGTNFFIDIDVGFSVVLGTWYHIAVDFDGTTYRLYVDGVVKGSSTTLRTLHNSTAVFSIGSRPNLVSPFDGHADEVRVTKGVARYAGAFTPPSSEFPNS